MATSAERLLSGISDGKNWLSLEVVLVAKSKSPHF
jgi:hypothetical protein